MHDGSVVGHPIPILRLSQPHVPADIQAQRRQHKRRDERDKNRPIGFAAWLCHRLDSTRPRTKKTPLRVTFSLWYNCGRNGVNLKLRRKPIVEFTMKEITRCVLVLIALLAALLLSTSEAPAVIKATSPLRLFVRDATQIVQVRVTRFEPDSNRLVFEVQQDLKSKTESPTMNVVWKLEPDSKWEGIRTLPRLLKSFGPDQEAILFINDTGGFWHNAGNERKNPIAFGFTNGSWFCLESKRLDNGKLLWQLAQGEPYLRTTFKGTTAELNKVLVDHLAGKGKLPDPVKEEPGFGPEYQAKK
jgi:hypothetical protein